VKGDYWILRSLLYKYARFDEVGLESERSKFGVSTKFEHSQTNKRHAVIQVFMFTNSMIQ
jgi:hypothetical protein